MNQINEIQSQNGSKDALKEWSRKNPAVAFFLITYVFSWGVWLPGLIKGLGLSNTEYIVLNVVGGFGPSLAAVLLVQIADGWSGVKKLLISGFDVRGMKLSWLAIMLLIFPALNLGYVLVSWVGFRALPQIIPMDTLSMVLYPLAFLFPLGNQWREEYGWRGFAQPLMQRKYGAFNSSIVIGVLWGFWHLPLFYFPTSQAVYARTNIVFFVIRLVALSLIMTWMLNGSGRLITATAAHFIAGAIDFFVVKSSTPYGELIYVGVELVLIAAIVLKYGTEKMASDEKLKI